MLLYALRRRIGAIDLTETVRSFVRVTVASALLGVVPGVRLATGLRSVVGMEWNPTDGQLYALRLTGLTDAEQAWSQETYRAKVLSPQCKG